MVFTLHRYVFREVFKVFILATIALTLMMSLGSILRPVQEFGVGPRQVVHLMVYFLPITLTFVLPIAALFASALIYGRLANDNELDACRASGISLMTLVYPGLILAILVSIANLLLSFYVMPAFVRRAERSVKDDARQILFRNIERKGYYMIPPDGRFRIYADYAELRNNVLGGVVAVEVRDNRIAKIITAESARVVFDPHENFNEVRINAYNTHELGPGEEASFAAEWLTLTAEFGALLRDDVKFKKIDEMKRIRSDPLLFYPVEKLARQTYSRLTTELLAEEIEYGLADGNEASCRLHSGRRVVSLSAERCVLRDETQIMLEGSVVITEQELKADSRPRTFDCSRAFINLEGDELTPTLTLDLRSAKWRDEKGLESIIGRHIIRGLILPEAVSSRFNSPDILAELRAAAAGQILPRRPSREFRQLQRELESEIARTLSHIEAELHSRLVFGVGCTVLILIGIALGIMLRGGHLLTAFAASVIPAMLLIVAIMMGKNITKNPEAATQTGILLMWGGLAALCVLGALLYRKLLKH